MPPFMIVLILELYQFIKPFLGKNKMYISEEYEWSL